MSHDSEGAHFTDHSARRLGVIGALAAEDAARLAEIAGISLVAPDAPPLDALIAWDQDVAAIARHVHAHTTLAWVHLRWAGVPPEVLGALRGRSTVLTNGSGAHGVPISEYVVATLLQHLKRLPEMREAQREGKWLAGYTVRELRGLTAGIIGLGDLGRSTARLLRAFGVHVRGLRRSAGTCPDVDETFGPPRLDEFLRGLDVLVIAAPLTHGTRGLIGAPQLARLASGAFLVNVGRAAIVDESALLEALGSGQLGGAALDVFLEEPLPAHSPLWNAPNLFLSPHCADASPQSLERGFLILLDNVQRFVAGEPLRNVVDPRLGY